MVRKQISIGAHDKSGAARSTCFDRHDRWQNGVRNTGDITLRRIRGAPTLFTLGRRGRQRHGLMRFGSQHQSAGNSAYNAGNERQNDAQRDKAAIVTLLRDTGRDGHLWSLRSKPGVPTAVVRYRGRICVGMWWRSLVIRVRRHRLSWTGRRGRRDWLHRGRSGRERARRGNPLNVYTHKNISRLTRLTNSLTDFMHPAHDARPDAL